MGSIPQQSLRSDPDASRPLGEMLQATHTTAMRIRRDHAGELMYEGEAINLLPEHA